MYAISHKQRKVVLLLRRPQDNNRNASAGTRTDIVDLTSSKFGEISKCRLPINLCERMLYRGNTSTLSSSALLWERNNEIE